MSTRTNKIYLCVDMKPSNCKSSDFVNIITYIMGGSSCGGDCFGW